jgi:hypothetical protein
MIEDQLEDLLFSFVRILCLGVQGNNLLFLDPVLK